MPLIQVFLTAVWTLVVVRALALRATLGLRTLATYLVLGAVLGPIALPVVEGFVNSYGSYRVYHWPFVALGVELLLLAPVLAFLFFRRAHQVTSVGDAFLLAFMIGFGYDLLTTAAGVASATQPVAGLSYLPPFAFAGQNLTIVGFGYWGGLIALAIAAAARSLRTRAAAYWAGAIALFWVVAEISGLASSQAPTSLLATVFGNMTLHGRLTPWVIVVALLGLSLWEGRWMSRAPAAGASQGLASQWSAVLSALVSGKLDEFRRLGRVSRLRRQVEFAKAELFHSPSDPYLKGIARDLEQQTALAQSALATVKAAQPITQSLLIWVKRQPLQLGLVAALVVIALLLPQSTAARDFFWKLSLLNGPLLSLKLSVLSCALIVIIAWRYLSAAVGPGSSANVEETLQFGGEDTILTVTLYCVFLALFYGKTEDLYSLKALPQLLGLAPTANYDHGQLTTVMLLIAAAASGVALKSSNRLRQQSMQVRRTAAVYRAMSLLVLLFGLEIVLLFFQHGQMFLHSMFGHLLFRIFGSNGNSVGDTLVGIVTVGFSFFVFWGLSLLSERVRNFLAPSQVPPGVTADRSQKGTP